MSYIGTSLAMAFGVLSPIVRKKLFDTRRLMITKLDGSQKLELSKIEKVLSTDSGHIVPIKWALDVIKEAKDKKEADLEFVNALVAEINNFHTQCDRFVKARLGVLSWISTQVAIIFVYIFCVSITVRRDIDN